jgi:hypothetical protein
MFKQISLAFLGLLVGGILTVVGIIAYAQGNATLNLAGFFYGIPLFLGGLALKAAELKPIPFSQPTSPEILQLRQEKATATQKQIIGDVTRYRYGQKAHLDESLQRLGLSPTDEERPILIGLMEMVIEDSYALVMEFESPLIALKIWQEKQEKLAKFFGPDIRVNVTQSDEVKVAVALISNN